MKTLLALILLASLGLSGCAGGFGRYYQGSSADEIKKTPGYVTCEKPEVGKLPDVPYESIINDMYAQGYTAVGTASWQGRGGDDDDNALNQAESLGACMVLWSAEYAFTATGTDRVERVIPGASYRVRGGWYREPDRVIIEYIPYAYDIFNYRGVFFVKHQPDVLGLQSTRTKSHKSGVSDNRVLVSAVRGGSIAESLQIMPGDIILSINDVDFYYDQPFEGYRYGAENTIKIYRNGETIANSFYLSAAQGQSHVPPQSRGPEMP